MSNCVFGSVERKRDFRESIMTLLLKAIEISEQDEEFKEDLENSIKYGRYE